MKYYKVNASFKSKDAELVEDVVYTVMKYGFDIDSETKDRIIFSQSARAFEGWGPLKEELDELSEEINFGRVSNLNNVVNDVYTGSNETYEALSLEV